MFGSDVIDVAIGMCFIFLLFSLICSALGELFEAFAKNRSSDLERGICELFRHTAGDQAVAQFYNHPLIYCLFSGPYVSGVAKKWWQRGRSLPAYIPAENFALALMDLALPATDTRASGAADALARPQDGPTAQSLREGVFQTTVLNDSTKRALVTLIDAAGNDVTKVRTSIESWFNSAMDRVSGRYKRRTQIILVCIALLVAVGANVDSIMLVNVISTQKSIRQALVSAAAEYTKDGAATVSSPACTDNSETCKFGQSVGQLEALGIPIGWSDQPFKKLTHGAPREDLWAWGMKLMGWAITAFAACLGAPFWFDALNRLMVVRSTVKPHEKSKEEKSKP